MPTKAQIKTGKARDLANYYLVATRSRAKSKGREFDLDKEHINSIIVPVCPVLGVDMDYYAEDWSKNNTASIDRIDNSKGYIKGNVWFVSNLFNSMKRNATVAQMQKFAVWVLKVYPLKSTH